MTSCKPVRFSRMTLHHELSKYVYISYMLQTCLVAAHSNGALFEGMGSIIKKIIQKKIDE